MKKALKTSVTFSLLIAAACLSSLHSQSWMEQLGKRAEEAAKRRIEKKLEEKVDKSVDKAFDKGEEKIKEKAKKKKNKSEDLEAGTPQNQATYKSKQSSSGPCHIYYPFRKGAQIEYTIYDHKNKVSGYLSQQITEVKNTAKGLKITAQSQHRDKKQKLNYSGKVHMRCEGNVFYADVRNLLDPKSLQAFQNESQVEISGIDISMPGNIQVGESLPDAEITLKIKTEDVPLPPTVIRVKQRKVLAREKISTPAGSFDCYKISSEYLIENIISIRMKTIEWTALNVGTVQSETYNDKDKCIARMQLSFFEE